MKLRYAALVPALLAGSLGAQQIRLLSSNGVRATVEAEKIESERAAGRPISADFSTTTSLMERIKGGEPFDVTILTKEAIEDLIHQGKVTAASRTPLAKVGIGLGIRAGAPKLHIDTPGGMRQALLNAKSITYTKGGASQPEIEKMFAALGVADQMKSKLMLEPPGQSTASVASGKAEIVMTLISEILPVKGIEFVGPLPKEFQHYSVFEGAVSAKAKNPAGAAAMLKFLASPDATPVFQAKGMER